jgi:hypothetical protein
MSAPKIGQRIDKRCEFLDHRIIRMVFKNSGISIVLMDLTQGSDR